MNRAAEPALAAWMAAAQAGDAAAYATLLRACLPLLAAAARRAGVAEAAVDDVVQETLMTLHRVRHTWDPTRPFLPWLYAIAARRGVDVRRRQGKHTRREVYDPLAYEAASDQGAAPSASLAAADAAQTVAAALATLPAAQREAVETLMLKEQTLREAAVTTGRNVGALKVNLHRALRTLRARLEGTSRDV